MLLGKLHRFFSALLLMGTCHATYTRVGNTYMKKPDTCCALDPLASRTDCAMTSLYATNRIQLSFSPSFPSRFPIGRVCLWSVQCQPGYQVRLEFRDFYLIGPGPSGQCVDQYVKITSPITGHSMGRFCGNSGIPTIVSAGNLVMVQLQSEIPQSSENYRGFAFVFRETLEAPNPEMRPSDWINHGQYSLDNREIARRLRNLRPTDASAIPTTLPSSPKTRPTTTTTAPPDVKPSSSLVPSGSAPTKRNPNPVRPTVTNNRKRPTVHVPPFADWPGNKRPSNNGRQPTYYGEENNRDVKIINPKNTIGPLSIEAWVGIGAGGVCFVLLCILIGCKIHQMRKKTRRNSNHRAQTQPTNTSGQPVQMVDLTPTTAVGDKPEKNQPLPESYHNQGFSGQNTFPGYHPGYYVQQEYPFPPAYATMPNTDQTQHETTEITYGSSPGMLPNQQFYFNSGQSMPQPYTQPTGPMLPCEPNTGLCYQHNPMPASQHPFQSPSQPTAPAMYTNPPSTHFPVAAPEYEYKSSSLSSDEELPGQKQRYPHHRSRNASRPGVQKKKRRNRRKRRR